jgi:hypothetical protein
MMNLCISTVADIARKSIDKNLKKNLRQRDLEENQSEITTMKLLEEAAKKMNGLQGKTKQHKEDQRKMIKQSKEVTLMI